MKIFNYNEEQWRARLQNWSQSHGLCISLEKIKGVENPLNAEGISLLRGKHPEGRIPAGYGPPGPLLEDWPEEAFIIILDTNQNKIGPRDETGRYRGIRITPEDVDELFHRGPTPAKIERSI